jgi:hypothetical protein
MTGHIHYPDSLSAWQFQVGESQLNGDASQLLFFESIRVGACQGFDQTGFAVVDVSGGAQNYLFHGRFAPPLCCTILTLRSFFLTVAKIGAHIR